MGTRKIGSRTRMMPMLFAMTDRVVVQGLAQWKRIRKKLAKKLCFGIPHPGLVGFGRFRSVPAAFGRFRSVSAGSRPVLAGFGRFRPFPTIKNRPEKKSPEPSGNPVRTTNGYTETTPEGPQSIPKTFSKKLVLKPQDDPP